jgi:hypothetical protein
MANKRCEACGRDFNEALNRCPFCSVLASAGSGAGNAPQTGSRRYAGTTTGCLALGLLCTVIGLYLLIDPSAAKAIVGPSIANLHKLALGQTLTIVGAIFLAAAIRPR